LEKTISFSNQIRAYVFLRIFAISFVLLICFLPSVSIDVHAVGTFSKEDRPFNITYDAWASEYWNKWIGKNVDEATPKAGGCLLVNDDNKSQPMVMLMETAVNSPPTQDCKISSNQGILVPLWIGWCDAGSEKGATAEQLTDCAKRQNLGRIISEVKVDGLTVANLDVTQSINPTSGALEYKINSLNNVTEFSSKPFSLIIPADTHKPNQVTGTWDSVSQGWWVFLEPLPVGKHTVYYNIRVTPTGALTSPGTSPHFSDINYNLDVVK
jgi:hypothetical protein